MTGSYGDRAAPLLRDNDLLAPCPPRGVHCAQFLRPSRRAGGQRIYTQFVKFWKERTGHLPEELIFDSKLTTYRNLNRLNKQQIHFITLSRRTPQLVHELQSRPRSAWRQIELSGVSRQYKTPRVLDEQVTLSDYDGPIRQITVADLGHDEPTLLLTNQLQRSATKLIERYAQRMLIETIFTHSTRPVRGLPQVRSYTLRFGRSAARYRGSTALPRIES